MIEMALLNKSKETDNKVRWDSSIDGTRFSIYIPKWRVPEPCPRVIRVIISPYNQNPILPLSEEAAKQDPNLRMNAITAHLIKYAEKSQTIRYRPVAREQATWEIGEPYIPIQYSYNGAERLTITVEWGY